MLPIVYNVGGMWMIEIVILVVPVNPDTTRMDKNALNV